MKYDVFISHASQDKTDVARPLAIRLQLLGLKVWIDESELTLGDSLRRSIDRGLSFSSYGVVILSPSFFSKEWPNRELDGLVAREDGRDKVILPVWHNVSSGEILKYSPTLADKLAVSTSSGIDHVADRIFEAVRRSTGAGEFADPRRSPTQDEILEKIRYKMLASYSSRELRGTLYEVEEFLAKYPHSSDAKLLKDSIQTAMRRVDELARPGVTMRSPLSASHGRGCLWLSVAGFLLYFLLRMSGCFSDSPSPLPPSTLPADTIISVDLWTIDKPMIRNMGCPACTRPRGRAANAMPMIYHSLYFSPARCSSLLFAQIDRSVPHGDA